MKAFLFPGQGSQKVGMGEDLFNAYEPYVEAASNILGYCLKTLCLDDPRKELRKTQFTQPALYVVSALMYLEQVKKEGVKPDVVAGHSLGEYNALFAAGAFSFEAGLKLVKKRAELMGEANGGSMAAIMGSSVSELKSLLTEDAFQGLDIASVNSSRQVVISGSPELIFKAATHFEGTDVKCYPLNVSAAFHSRHMKPAADEFLEYLRNFEFAPHTIPVVSNVFARPYDQSKSPQTLASQIYSSVNWKESIQYMMAMGVSDFVEVGPGSVLTNMQKSIDADPSLKLEDSETLKFQRDAQDMTMQTSQIKNDLVSSSAFDIASSWNNNHSIGAKIRLSDSGEIYETKSKAMVLFGNKAVIYLTSKNGFFPLNEVRPLS